MVGLKQTEKRKLVESSTSIWKNHDFVRLWIGQTVSVIGSSVSTLALPLLVLALTHSPEQAGFISACGTLPYFFLTLPAGALVDRWDRRRVMIICDIGRAFCLASIPIAIVFGHLTVLQLYIVMLLEGTFAVFFGLAATASVPSIVLKEHIAPALSLVQVSDGMGDIVGSPLGGFLYSLGYAFPFLTDAVSYIASIGSLFFIRKKFQKARVKKNIGSLYKEVIEGLHWLWQHPAIRSLAVLTSGINFIFPTRVLIIVVLLQHQNTPPPVIGAIFSAAACGFLFGALVSTYLQKKLRIALLTKLVFWLFVLFWPLLALAPNPLLVTLVLIGLSIVRPIYGVTQMSYRLSLIPDSLQGRVNSILRLAGTVSQPLGLALAGVLLQNSNTSTTILVFWCGLILLAIIATFNRHLQNASI